MTVRLVIYSVLLLTFISCRGLRTPEGWVRPVYFTPDPGIFEDTLYPEQAISYHNFLYLKGDGVETVELNKGKTSKGYIRKPTFFRKGGVDEFLVYPGDEIIIRGDYDDYTFSKANGNKRRNKELLFFKTFRELEKWPTPPRIPYYDLQTILDFEQEQKKKIIETEAASRLLFDSLLHAYHVSKKFKRLTKNYLRNRYDMSLVWVYELYKDTLKAHGLFYERLKQFIPVYNEIKKSEFNANTRYILNDMVRELFPNNKMWSMPGEDGFRNCFDSIEANFTGLPREYLLSRVMYRAHSKGIKPTPEYEKKYRDYSNNKVYRKLVNRVRQERARNDADTIGVKNQLLAAEAQHESSLEEILARHKGKIILVDLWASWCGPCMNELPYLEQLKQKYPEDKIVFLNISIDKYTNSWQKAIRESNMEKHNQYLLLNAERASFGKQIGLRSIPRYLVFDKEGKMIHSNAPLPSDPALSVLLDKLIFTAQSIKGF